MNWKLHETITYRRDDGQVWKITEIWVNTNTLAERQVHFQGVALDYIREATTCPL